MSHNVVCVCVSNSLHRDGFDPDAHSLSTLAEAHAADGNLAQAAFYLQELRRLALPASEAATAAFARTAAALNDEARTTWLTNYMRHATLRHSAATTH